MSLIMLLADKLAKLRDKVRDAVNRLTAKIPPEKRYLVLMFAAGAVGLVLLIIVGAFILSKGKTAVQDAPPARTETVRQGVIPPEDLFLPDEPDFLPGVIPEREQRTEWTEEDAAPFWQNPLKDGEEPWRDHIEKTIDEIMESVP
jgi:hypothetical protein